MGVFCFIPSKWSKVSRNQWSFSFSRSNIRSSIFNRAIKVSSKRLIAPFGQRASWNASRRKGTVKEDAFWTTDKPGETWTNDAEQTVPKKPRDFTRLIFSLVERYRLIIILSKYTARKFTVLRTFYNFARDQFIFLYLGIVFFFITIIIPRLKCVCLLFFSCFSVLSNIKQELWNKKVRILVIFLISILQSFSRVLESLKFYGRHRVSSLLLKVLQEVWKCRQKCVFICAYHRILCFPETEISPCYLIIILNNKYNNN